MKYRPGEIKARDQLCTACATVTAITVLNFICCWFAAAWWWGDALTIIWMVPLSLFTPIFAAIVFCITVNP